MSDLENRVQSVFRRVFSHDSLVLKREMTALDIDGWDSLNHIQLIVALEKEFKVKFKPTDVIGLKNVGEMVDLVRQALAL
ncbi:MAG: acyl carrier protein [Deltaproteobacteria bacterium]|nr:acyl carrier protein [Deltaproteobacteria bacterium]